MTVTVLEDAGMAPGSNRRVKCRCDCGQEFVALHNNVKRGLTKSCGHTRGLWVKHGHTKGDKCSPEYNIWASMRQRCINPKNRAYPNYGGRGIRVCERWDTFALFLEDMGQRPGPGLSLDRINNDGNYEPTNCRWATAKQQCANRRPRKNWRIIVATLEERVSFLEKRMSRLEGERGGSLATDSDLDGEHGDPTIKFDPKEKYWTGTSYVGCRFSQCPVDYLKATAKYLDACVYMAEKAGELDKARWKRLDASRARGWAARIENGWKAKAPSDIEPDGGEEGESSIPF